MWDKDKSGLMVVQPGPAAPLLLTEDQELTDT